MRTLTEYAEDALDACSDLLSDEAYARLEDKSDLKKIEYRYLHADCDDFAYAMMEILGFTLVSLVDTQGLPIHRLVQSPSGEYLDISGWTDIEKLSKSYNTELKIGSDHFFSPSLEESELSYFVDLLRQFKRKPFSEHWFQEKLEGFAKPSSSCEITFP